MSTTKLDEKALRRPDFLGGEPIRLADGQEWAFPRPEIRFVRDRTERGYLTRASFPGPDGPRWDAGFDRLASAWDEATESGSFGRVVASQLAIAEYMLLLNYDLTLEQVQDLLQFTYTAEPDETRSAILAVATGNDPAPKPPSGGSD